MDWPYWRGPEMNGHSREKNMVDSWSPRGKNLLWKKTELAGRSTPIVMNGKLYMLVRDQPGTKKEGEKVVCIDAASGKPLWENRFNVYLSDVPDTRVGWSSVVGDPSSGDVYALGVCGYFQRINGKTGKTVWSHSLSEEYGLLSTYGGRTNFPVIHKNLVIISAIVIGWGKMAKPAHRFIGFDKRNGQPVWFEGTRPLPYDTTYSSAITTVLNGQAALVFGSGDGGVHAFQPQTGKRIWTYNVSGRGINTTPLIVGNTVYCGHSEENIGSNKMGALFAIDGSKTGDITKTGTVWKHDEMFVGKSSPIYVDGRIYACTDTGTLLVLDAKSGKKVTTLKLRGPMRSSPLYADGKIFICTENTIWWTLQPTKTGVKVLTRERLRAGSSYGSPIVSHGRIYVPTTKALYCIGKKGAKPVTDPRPAPPKVTPVTADPTPAVIRVVPVEVLLRPGPKGVGERQEFQVRLYNAHGQFLRMASADEITMTVAGPGSVAKTGSGKKAAWKYATPEQRVIDAATITAKVGKLSSTARVRVFPDLPWNIDFADGQVPLPWVGIRYRHIPLDFDLYQSLKKQNLTAARLYLYFTTSFVNFGRTALKYDDSSPKLLWTNLLRFLHRENDVKVLKNLADAKKALGPALDLLQKQQVLAGVKWSEWSNGGLKGIRLIAERGPRKITGNGVMVKIKTIPKGTRSQGWIGPIGFHDYTMQADVFAESDRGRLPDIGIIAQRYTLAMQGAKQRLHLRTWPTQDRMAKSVPFKWKANVWYTMKLRAAVEDGKAVLRGKVWLRGQKEPAKWMIEAVDPSPNRIGSPGFYGNATPAEIFYDNIKVTKNQ